MDKSLFYYDLPSHFIAQKPVEPRDSSKLMVININQQTIAHKHFYDIVDYLTPNDLLVLNDSKVLPARLIGYKINNNTEIGAKIEFLLIKQKEKDIWEVLVKPAKRLKIGSKVVFGEGILKAELISVLNNGNRLIKFEYDNNFFEILDQIGQMPLPHYITEKLKDKNRYQTIYSKNIGSIAAPTAGLHFTNDLFARIRNKNINICYVTLHVGIGTFRPVASQDLTKHNMHSENYYISKETAQAIKTTKKNNGRIIAVGTTTCRVLETVAKLNGGSLTESSGSTDIFIYPPYKFKVVDGLITNFHLPESTLIMLVSALAGRKLVLTAYEEAKNNKYRFYSFGDAMFLI